MPSWDQRIDIRMLHKLLGLLEPDSLYIVPGTCEKINFYIYVLKDQSMLLDRKKMPNKEVKGVMWHSVDNVMHEKA